MPVEIEPSKTDIQRFRDDGFIVLRDVIQRDEARPLEKAVTCDVEEHNPMHSTPMEQRTTYEKAFIQVIRLWRESQAVSHFVFGKVLPRIAAGLMGARGVRLHHDQALFKEPRGGLTPWHAGQFYRPLDSDSSCSVWIQFQDTPLDMGPFTFSWGSHRYLEGRDLAISDGSEASIASALDGSEASIASALSEEGYEHVESPFNFGDISFHCGWTYHRAGPNRTTQTRRAFTVIYIEDGIRLTKPTRHEHVADMRAYIPGRVPGQLVDTALNSLLFKTLKHETDSERDQVHVGQPSTTGSSYAHRNSEES